MTLAQVLQQTAPVSILARKAMRLGIGSRDAQIGLAVSRGCRHYRSPSGEVPVDPGPQTLSNKELAILLISGSQEYNLTAIRCAAQLIRSPDVDPKELAFLAIKEKSERPLRHIASAGLEHDPEGRPFWEMVLDRLGQASPRPENDLPHWTRFVSMPGYQRGKVAGNTWLTPTP